MTNEKFFSTFIACATKAYIEVMGVQKWDSLTDVEKHDAIMTLAHGMYNYTKSALNVNK